jgi:hypothetical protein
MAKSGNLLHNKKHPKNCTVNCKLMVLNAIIMIGEEKLAF